ncbi:hypothetical protein PR202_gb16256 [Eleusine coracana subsp. coracana]|uniref:DUF4220 domain-containing protein n=1 Tax=Eleusine coracana subsp. coracana TaxID=191504 RepID=A0AAV5F0F3_ELECO|nr:hypothetical protein QOZ80_9BG0700780 [Eleusine coracana subsp. coracana]GJN28163.1 hypothetical protein PR202_gb16256 [Eleusine coracana subsp. coracana]
MARGGVMAVAWKEWGLQTLVLLSLTIQVTLVISAEFRRHIDSGVLRALVWSAYMLADATAIYVLGHLSVTSRSTEHKLLPLWAPFLLLHLGGQDKITAYAIEDNRLWLRHLQTYVVQVAAAAYILYGSSMVGGSWPPLLLTAIILMFMVGVVKYGERVWALKRASSNPSTGNYKTDIGRRTFNQSVPESLIRRLDRAETFVLNGHMLLDLAKDKFKGPLPRPFLCGPKRSESQLHGEENLYNVAEMQLSLLHDVFYTKAEVTHTWHGLCIRVLSSLATVVAFLLFNMLLLGNHHRRLKGYNRADITVTYVLFVGAVVLETTSLLRAILSSWTCALLVKHGSGGSAVCNSLARVPLYLRRLVRAAHWRRQRSWSRSMGQLNLIQLCVRSRASRWSKMAKRIGAEDWWNMLAYSGPSIPVSACIKNLLMKSMKAKQWGREEFESRGLYGDPSWVADSKLEERILIWHIATEVYLFWYKKKKDQERAEATGAADLVEVAQALSNYLLFLLASRPHMMPPDANRNDYLVLCYALTNHMRYSTPEELLSLLERYADALWANNSKPEFELTCKNTNRRADKVLRGGCSLGGFLMHQQDSTPAGGDTGTLEMICRVWAQMLCCVADECSVTSHVKQLSNGAEFLTDAALIAKYMKSRMLSAYFHIKSERTREW